ncbi:zinc knuckle (CCHC-type) family protein [Euphorbia peplus]|nr:zinc knuckle (CCHC-type) family protein [Euphorbia peplus]
MNADEKYILPSTDLSLSLGYSNQCIQRLLNEDPGTGANAASTLDMTFVATNTLAELVWSPKRGLCLQCADRSFTNQEPSLLYGLETINMASESSSDKSLSIARKPINKEICMASLAACKLGSEVAQEDNSSMLPSSNANIIPLGGTATLNQPKEVENVVDMNSLPKEDPRRDKGEDEFKPDMAQNYPAAEEPLAKFKDICEGTHALRMEIVVAPVIHATRECEAHYAASSGRSREKMPSLLDQNKKGKMGTRDLLEHMEATAENDLENWFGENAFCVATEAVALKSADKCDSNIPQDDGLLHADKTVALKEYSSNSKFQKDCINGKSIVLADQDGDRMMLNEEDRDGSNDTVESCNSTGQISTGKRTWNFEQTLIVQNKRVKRQVHESPSSSSRPDSSFMNWIANMTKGFSRLPEGEAPLCASLSNPAQGHENADQDNKNKELKSTNVGFQSIFRSLYSRNGKRQEAVTFNSDHEMKVSKELGQENKIYDMNATPIACCMGTGTVYNQFLLTGERFNESTSGNQVGPSVHSKNIPMDLAVIRESNTNSTENINSNNLATSKEKDGTSSNFSHGKYNANSVEKVDSEIPFERKTVLDSCFRGDPLESSWVARYTSRRSGAFRNQDPSKKPTGEPPNPQLQNTDSSSNVHGNDEVAQKCSEEVSRVQNCDTAAEASSGFYKIKGQHNDKSDYKLNRIQPSSRCNSPEAMASVFARRLDALKHIVPSDDPDREDYATMTCYFCGIKGHHLRECPEIVSSELEDLLRNFSLYDVKKLSCVCIRCFQSNHWAVSCPSVCKRLRNEPERDTSLPNQCRPSKMSLDVRNDIDMKQEDTAPDALKACYYNSSGMEKDIAFNLKSNEASTSRKMPLDAKKEIASSSEDKRLNQMAPLYSAINDQISDLPYGVFDAIRSLRLTRTDVLKWLNSGLPVSHLDGFFLRLRLGKWEEGLGGTGYYAAYISGEQMESSLDKSKTSIAVNVGGMKCSVKSQYVSNQDFLEDELRAWWSATLRGGDKIPSEEELRMKVKEKKMLGF